MEAIHIKMKNFMSKIRLDTKSLIKKKFSDLKNYYMAEAISKSVIYYSAKIL